MSDPRPGKAISHISVADYRAKVLNKYQVVGEYARSVVVCGEGCVCGVGVCVAGFIVMVAVMGCVVCCYRRPGTYMSCISCNAGLPVHLISRDG